MLARSKLNSIESKISETLINNQIIHEDFTAFINEERNHRELKESIRMIKSQRSNTEKILSSLDLKTPVSNIPLFGDILY